MTREITAAIKTLVIATLLATGALAPRAASAQEAITLEAIGPVHMTQPSEVERSRSHFETPTPASTEVGHVEHHADNQ